MRHMLACAAALLLSGAAVQDTADAQRRNRPATAARAAPRATAPTPNWSQRIERTAEGGYRMGNPDAPVKVVEFVSLTCPHCRDFAATGGRQLVDNHVRTGRVSFEIRPFPLDIIAATGAQLTACVEPGHAFALHDEVLAAQEAIFSRVQALSQADVQAIERLGPAEQRVRIAEVTGMGAIAARHGLDAQRAGRCLTDEAGAQRIIAIKSAAERIGIQGTPSFTINGTVAQNVHDWASLEPLLRRGS